MQKCYIDYIIKNNDENIKKNNILAHYKKNKNIDFKDEDSKFNINIEKDKIILKKETNDSLIIFEFIENKKTQTKYYIKELNFYIDTEIITNLLIINTNEIIIEYELWISGEYTGKFQFNINIKELQL